MTNFFLIAAIVIDEGNDRLVKVKLLKNSRRKFQRFVSLEDETSEREGKETSARNERENERTREERERGEEEEKLSFFPLYFPRVNNEAFAPFPLSEREGNRREKKEGRKLKKQP